MRYMGSKRKIASEILPIILKGRKRGQVYVEPFCGGLNTLLLVEGRRIASDIHAPLIAMYKDLQRGRKFPAFISEEDYYRIKNSDDLGLVGYAGFTHSFGAIFYGGYRRNKQAGNLNSAEVGLQALSMVEKLDLNGIEFINSSYDKLSLPPKSLIYCDPPYEGIQEYNDRVDKFKPVSFNHTHFWLWAESMKCRGHTIFIPEYSAPSFFKKVWSKEVKTLLSKEKTNQQRIENLYTI